MLENYSLYTTLLVAFIRKAGSMSFKVGLRAWWELQQESLQGRKN